jgi:hypothetical protein
MTARKPNALLTAALEYAEQGFLVFPCSESKTPLTEHGFQDASDDAKQISAWWAKHPRALVGVAVPEGMIVVDVDPRNGGAATYRALQTANGGSSAFPRTWRVQTAGGGSHRWYAVDPELRLRGKLGDGIDVKRAEKGYVIAPPSTTSAGAYTWEWRGEIADAPEWMVDLLRRPEPQERATEDRTPPSIFPFMDGTAYGEKALANELARLGDANPGERNDALNRAAYSLGQLIAGGELKEEPVREALTAAAADIGLEEEEAEKTLASGILAGLLEPRTAPALPDRGAPTQESPGSLLGGPGDDEGEDEQEGDPEHFWLDLDGDDEPAAYIVDPVLPRNAYVLVYGAAEAAKSMVFGLLAAEASLRGYTSTIYSLENPPHVDRHRFKRMALDGSRLRVTNQLVNLADPAQARAMAEREMGRDLVILDTYSHVFAQRYDSGDGNAKAIEFARVIRWLMRKTGATFVVIDHTGFERPEEPRDASAKRQQVDVAIGMERTQQWERDKPMHFLMTNYKSGRFGNPFRYEGQVLGRTSEALALEWKHGVTLTWGGDE